MIVKKLLYVYVGNYEEKSGVVNKLSGLFLALEKKGVEWTLFTGAASITEKRNISKNIYALPVNYLKRLSDFYLELHLFIKSNPVYDVYFLRYPLASKQLLCFLKKYPQKFILEHNTIEIAEIKHKAKEWVKKYKIRPTPSYLKLLFNTLLKPVFIETYYGKKVLQLAKGGVAVTEEIAKHEKSRYLNYKCNTLPNGIDVMGIKFYKRKFADGDVLNLILLVNCAVDWHGIDLVLASFNMYKGNRIRLTLIGELNDKVRLLSQENKNVRATGFLSANEFEVYMQAAHLGLGSFALFRKNLEEASTLKIREYLASGLPVFLGHTDTDIEQSPLKKYSFKIDIRTQPIDWDSIYQWAVKLYTKSNLNEDIRSEAFKQIDFSKKVELLMSF